MCSSEIIIKHAGQETRIRPGHHNNIQGTFHKSSYTARKSLFKPLPRNFPVNYVRHANIRFTNLAIESIYIQIYMYVYINDPIYQGNFSTLWNLNPRSQMMDSVVLYDPRVVGRRSLGVVLRSFHRILPRRMKIKTTSVVRLCDRHHFKDHQSIPRSFNRNGEITVPG